MISEMIASSSHQISRVNVVMATLAVLGRMVERGVIRSDELYRPEVSPEQLVLLEAATATQTELSLSINSSDPLISDVAHKIVGRIEAMHSEKRAVETVLEADRRIHEAVELLAGRGTVLSELASSLEERGEITISEVARALGI